MTLEEAKKRIKELDSGYRFGGSNYESGWEDALCRVTEILDEIDTKPVGNPDKMTLKELAREMRKIFRFRYLTCDGCGDLRDYSIWLDKPEYTRDGWLFFSVFGDPEPAMMLFESRDLAIDLDLSEYADENGNIDYSKCIVEVE